MVSAPSRTEKTTPPVPPSRPRLRSITVRRRAPACVRAHLPARRGQPARVGHKSLKANLTSGTRITFRTSAAGRRT